MRIGRLTILLLALCGAGLGTGAAISAQDAPPPQQQAQPAVRTVTVPLRPEGAWTDTGLVVAQGDRLRFEASPADSYSRQIMPGIPPPTYAARIGEQAWPITPGSNFEAQAGGPLQVAVEFPQVPAGRWPRMVMTVGHEPRPAEVVPPDPTENLPLDTGNTLIGNGVDIATEGNQVEAPVPPPAKGATAAVPPDPPPPEGPDWTVIALAAAAAAVALATLIALSRGTKAAPPAAAPAAVTIHPSLDMSQGETSGDPISLAGPEVRLRAALEPGGTFFDGDGPVVEREERDG